MANSEILSKLQECKELLRDRYGVKSLSLFGSHARGEAGSESDVDLLVEFTDPATFEHYMALKFHLEDLLGRPVDLVTRNAVRRELKPYIEKDAIRVS